MHRTFWAVALSFMLGSVAQAGINPYNLDLIAEPLNRPWAVVALPDDRFIVTEMHGTLAIVSPTGEITRSTPDLPKLYAKAQGGFLDIALTQDFALSGKVMLTYAAGSPDKNVLVVASAELTDDGLQNVRPVFQVNDAKDTPVHYGGRLGVLNDGTWLVTTGDGFDYREHAQILTSQMGKVLHLREDGQAPQVSPFSDAPYVYSLGHRNPQGLVVDSETGTIYELEHGPDGGDEINVIEAGKNYGWPVITKGVDYSGAKITPYTEYPGMEQPLVNWTPSVAPSSMALYQKDMFPSLKGKMLVTTLKSKALFAVDLDTGESEHIVPELKERLRDVIVAEDGSILILTDRNNAKLYRISAK